MMSPEWPLKAKRGPRNFFESIRIDDPAFA